ncbi:MAG: hypothetical protein AAF078_11735, partial [Planctomycetota bacterium]
AFLTAFEVLDHQPYNLKRLKRTLAAHHAGLVEVKTRDQVVNPDTLQPQLRGPAPPAPPPTHTRNNPRRDPSHPPTHTKTRPPKPPGTPR